MSWLTKNFVGGDADRSGKNVALMEDARRFGGVYFVSAEAWDRLRNDPDFIDIPRDQANPLGPYTIYQGVRIMKHPTTLPPSVAEVQELYQEQLKEARSRVRLRWCGLCAIYLGAIGLVFSMFYRNGHGVSAAEAIISTALVTLLVTGILLVGKASWK